VVGPSSRFVFVCVCACVCVRKGVIMVSYFWIDDATSAASQRAPRFTRAIRRFVNNHSCIVSRRSHPNNVMYYFDGNGRWAIGVRNYVRFFRRHFRRRSLSISIRGEAINADETWRGRIRFFFLFLLGRCTAVVASNSSPTLTKAITYIHTLGHSITIHIRRIRITIMSI
jgi:hypothetical protein